MLRISVLGPVEVSREGRQIPVPGGKTSELLVRLALEAGLFVSADRLIEDIWAAEAAATRPNTLQSKVTRLRRAFGDPGMVVSSAGRYKLAVPPDCVDALVVLRDAAEAGRLLDAGEPAAARGLCSGALTLFAGDLLQAAGDSQWAMPHRARLDEARMKLIETQLSARSQLEAPSGLIGELEDAVASYPYREELWELLISSLYRAGRQTEGLEAYQRVRVKLADELALAPGPRLREIEQKILNQDPALSAGFATARPVTAAAPGNLPSLQLELVGRAEESARLRRLLVEKRLVEVLGTPGIGKTALAIACGQGLSGSDAAPVDGIWLVRLEGAATADEVMDAVIAALRVSGGEAALHERIREQDMLVIFDNCEHVRAEVAALAVSLLDAAAGLRIICTSQVALGVDGETLLELSPLGQTDSVELFGLRAEERQGAGARAEAAPEVDELCRSLDGLPLAIELAAARTRTLSVAEITRRLDDRFSVLSDPTSPESLRRRSLRETLLWSYELLFPDDKRGLWALAAFADSASLSAAESVLEALDVPASAAIDVIERLASRSLVRAEPAENSAAIRYRLLDSIRAFALEAATDAGAGENAFAAHADWYATAADSATAGVRSSRQAEHLAFARVERANIDSALGWCAANDPPLGVRIAEGFGWAWIVLGDSRGAQRILAALDAAGGETQAGRRTSGLLLAAWIEASTGHLGPAGEHVAEAAALADLIDDDELRARSAYYLAYVVSHEGDFTQALELTDRAGALLDGVDRPWDQAANWLFAARAAISARDLARAAEARDRVDHWLRIVEDPWLHVRRDAMHGELARIENRFDDAVRHITLAAETSGRLGFSQTNAYQLTSLGRAHCQAGDYRTGIETLELGVERAEAVGDARLVALGQVHLGRVLRAVGRTDEARAALVAAAAFHDAAGGGEQSALGDCLLAALDAEAETPGAGERLTESLAGARRDGDDPVAVFALDALGRIARESGEENAARELAAEADRRMDGASHFITARDRVDAPGADQPV